MTEDNQATNGTPKNAHGLPARSEGALIRGPLGRPVATGLLTGRQKLFVKHMVATGGHQTLSAEMAGYATPAAAAYQLMHLPHVAEALRQARVVALESLAMQAPLTLREVMEDKKAPAAARVAASKLALELAGHFAGPLGAGSPDLGRDLEKLSVQELEELVSKGADALVKVGRMLDVTPQSGS